MSLDNVYGGRPQTTPNFDLTDLIPFQHPLNIRDISGDIQEGIFERPTFSAYSQYRHQAELKERRSSALGFASQYLRRTISNDKRLVFSRRLTEEVFPELDSKLGTLLTEVRYIKSASGIGYAVKRETYSTILRMLYNILKDLKNFVLIEGYAIPGLPIWGKDGDVSIFHRENEYEILAIAFRTEVEQFLRTFDTVYDFNESQPRNLALRNLKGYSSEESSVSQRTRSIPRVAPSERNNVERQYAAHAFRTRDSENLSNSSSAENGLTEIQAKPSSSFLTNLLGNIGDKFQTAEPKQRFTSPPSARLTHQIKGIPNHNYLGSSSDQPQRILPQIPKTNVPQPASTKGPYFDVKLKPEMVPKWDGNTNTLVRWIAKINNLALMSKTVFNQLGQIVPRRLEGSAETWYWSLPSKFRDSSEKNWDTLRNTITDYYMNRKWLDQQKGKAIRAYYREPGHSDEMPSEYFIRKRELLDTVWTLDDSELILEVMNGAPANWNTVLTTQLYPSAVDFQTAIKYHEDTLMDMEFDSSFQHDQFAYGGPDEVKNEIGLFERTSESKVQWENTRPSYIPKTNEQDTQAEAVRLSQALIPEEQSPNSNSNRMENSREVRAFHICVQKETAISREDSQLSALKGVGSVQNTNISKENSHISETRDQPRLFNPARMLYLPSNTINPNVNYGSSRSLLSTAEPQKLRFKCRVKTKEAINPALEIGKITVQPNVIEGDKPWLTPRKDYEDRTSSSFWWEGECEKRFGTPWHETKNILPRRAGHRNFHKGQEKGN